MLFVSAVLKLRLRYHQQCGLRPTKWINLRMMRGRFAVLRSNRYIYVIPFYIVVYLVSLDSQKNKLLGNIIC